MEPDEGRHEEAEEEAEEEAGEDDPPLVRRGDVGVLGVVSNGPSEAAAKTAAGDPGAPARADLGEVPPGPYGKEVAEGAEGYECAVCEDDGDVPCEVAEVAVVEVPHAVEHPGALEPVEWLEVDYFGFQPAISFGKGIERAVLLR